MPHTSQNTYVTFRRRLVAGSCLLIALLVLSLQWKIDTAVCLSVIVAVLVFGGHFALKNHRNRSASESDQRRLGEALASSERRLQTIANNLPMLITYVDRDQVLRFANETMARWTGISPSQAVNRKVAEIFGPTLYAERKHYIEQALSGERTEFEAAFEVGGVKRHSHAVYVPDIQPDGTVHGFYTLTSDVSALKESEQRLAVLARTDTLTGLASRNRLNEDLATVVKRQERSGEPLAVMCIDIDHFKQINDSFGHATGDLVLTEFAKRLNATVRATDCAARLSGDKFVVVLEELHGKEGCIIVAEKIMRAMEPAFVCGPLDQKIGTSIGIAYANCMGETPDQLLERADKGLSLAKSAGRGTYAEYVLDALADT